jgi:CTP synthase (UTP-ammonia lyase)
LGAVSTRIAIVGDESTHTSHVEVNAVRRQLADDVTSDVFTEWVPTDDVTARDLSAYDGVWLVPGGPYRDDDAVLAAVRWARTSDVPFLGTCSGLQYAVLEYARDVLGQADASHAEADGVNGSNVVVPLACSLQGQERMVSAVPGSFFATLVDEPFAGMHFCGYGPDAAVVERLVAGGMVVGATADDAPVEVLELPTHRFFVLSLFQPHIGASADRPLHPLLAAFVRAAHDYAASRSAARRVAPLA